eukprot:CAMPEP_0182901070 /NCGR_PEP_ID=MMETSP0034_2-20130328/29346_1 /TAXON_ID=156128 /ORGANISM="Nephroselmis pyriformis, Strain CCMP717" /LENGTH=78 /DNA_ID=CAMNT_0025035395 /DNA_START=6 /DNA_END=242 /DNA_ORIENTATION=+
MSWEEMGGGDPCLGGNGGRGSMSWEEMGGGDPCLGGKMGGGDPCLGENSRNPSEIANFESVADLLCAGKEFPRVQDTG